MAILVKAHDPNGSKERAAEFEGLHERLKQAPGFIFHCDYPVEGEGWYIVDAWESREDFERWFETAVKPVLPGGQPAIPPEIHELAAVVLK